MIEGEVVEYRYRVVAVMEHGGTAEGSTFSDPLDAWRSVGRVGDLPGVVIARVEQQRIVYGAWEALDGPES